MVFRIDSNDGLILKQKYFIFLKVSAQTLACSLRIYLNLYVERSGTTLARAFCCLVFHGVFDYFGDVRQMKACVCRVRYYGIYNRAHGDNNNHPGPPPPRNSAKQGRNGHQF